jgi:sugar O-acyltransferase (sialic acid O-acetyltransferase NeuD family)
MNFIVGSGGFSKEVYCVLRKNGIDFGGFVGLDEAPVVIGRSSHIPIPEERFLGSREYEGSSLYVGVGNPGTIRAIRRRYEGYEFPNLVDKDCDFVGDVEMGEGNIFCSGCVLTTNIKIGSFNVFNLNCTIGHDCDIGSFNVFNPTCCISGGVRVGDCNLFGVNSAVLENICVGGENTIGAMALVTRDVDSNGTYVGIPAKRR